MLMRTPSVHSVYLSLISLSLLIHFIPWQAEGGQAVRASATLDSKLIGILEKVHIGENKDLEFFAKIDSGAETSSIHAQNIVTYNKQVDDKEVLFVEFETIDESGKRYKIDRPVVKIDNVRSSLGRSRRFYIQEKIWIGSDAYFVNVNLADRTHLKRKFLVGKNVLNDHYVIDTSSVMLTSR
jgi:hypothetical protein